MKSIETAIKYLEEVNQVNLFFELSRFNVFRALMNITMPTCLSDNFYALQDEILKDYYKDRKVVDVDTLAPLDEIICLYKGDITMLKADAIVNACNEKLLGCFQPLHACIDNAIHSFAGLQVRRDLMEIMKVQGQDEENGKCKVTKGYNLHAKYIFHTVGPKVFRIVSKTNEKDLKKCYLSCLKKADEMNLRSIVFCSISTGLYGYPIDEASKIAISTVKGYLKNNKTSIRKVIFNVFSDGDYDVYDRRIKELD